MAEKEDGEILQDAPFLYECSEHGLFVDLSEPGTCPINNSSTYKLNVHISFIFPYYAFFRDYHSSFTMPRILVNNYYILSTHIHGASLLVKPLE